MFEKNAIHAPCTLSLEHCPACNGLRIMDFEGPRRGRMGGRGSGVLEAERGKQHSSKAKAFVGEGCEAYNSHCGV